MRGAHSSFRCTACLLHGGLLSVKDHEHSFAIEEDPSSFQVYSSRALTATRGAGIDHGVLAVRYGTDVGPVQDRCGWPL